MKFSFLVPVFNGEKYIEKCVESLVNQSYKGEYEIIITDDGSTDNTYKVLKSISKKHKNVKVYTKKNGGVSNTRNFMVKKCSSDYFIFVDSDDAVDIDLLETINKNLKKNTDIIKYQFTTVDISGNDICKYEDDYFELDGISAFNYLVEKKNFFDVVWLYAFNRNFWLNNNLKFIENVYHEDFGLIPYAILLAKKIISINFNGYYYVQTENSIMRTNSESKEIKKAENLLVVFDDLRNKVAKLNLDDATKTIFDSYTANALLLKANSVPKKHLNKYIVELKKRKISDLVITNSFVRKIKRFLIKYNLKLYIYFQKISKK